MAVVATLVRALQLDDGRPDNVCPGCGQDITGWADVYWTQHMAPDGESYRQHRPSRRGVTGVAWPWTIGTTNMACPWDRDMLLARRFRRDYIAAASDAELGEALDELDRVRVAS